MRWERLFDDLEAQWVAQERRERDVEVADRTRRERATVELLDRLVAHVGNDVVVRLLHGSPVEGRLEDVGDGWVLVEARTGTVLLRTQAVRAWVGPTVRAAPSRRARRFGLGYALRGISRDRRAVVVTDVCGGSAEGTVEGVGADHFDLSEHPADQPRRSEHVRSRTVIPFAALVSVRVVP